MMNSNRNYQKEMERQIEMEEKRGHVPTLLLHSCCAPCSSYVLEYLSQFFYITVYYYNPNIYPPNEYDERVKEQERLIGEMDTRYPVRLIKGDYEPELFYQTVKGHEKDEEGKERCMLCYEMRLTNAARIAKEQGFDYFTTTLSISPLKNAGKLNEIGEKAAKEYGVSYLNSDFKKKNGYKRSTELSQLHHLYRQNYCGCVYSMARIKEREETQES